MDYNEKAKKLLNLLLGDGASDGEIINSRNLLKKICKQNNIKITLGENNNHNKKDEDPYCKLYDYYKEKSYNLETRNGELQIENNKLIRENTGYKNKLNTLNNEISKYKEQLKNQEISMKKLKIFKKNILITLCIIPFIMVIIFNINNYKNSMNTSVIHKFSTFSKNKQDYFYLIMNYQEKEHIQYKDYEKYVKSFKYVKTNDDISKTLKHEYNINKDNFNVIYDDDYYRNNTLLKYKGE